MRKKENAEDTAFAMIIYYNDKNRRSFYGDRTRRKTDRNEY